CTTDDDCQNDTYCQDGHCVPYGTASRGGFNPGCNRLVPAGLLSPQIFCEWSGPASGDPFPNHKQVLSTPLVVDFNFDNHRNPDVRDDIATMTSNGSLIAFQFDMHNNTWTALWTSSSSPSGASCLWSGPALADLDDDGHPEALLEGTVFDSAGQLVDGSITR